jgi:archaellum component FlaC
MENKFYNELSKFKKAEKVEFQSPLTKNLKGFIKNIDNELKNFDINIKELKDVKRSIEVSIEQAAETLNIANKRIKGLEVAAKDFGIVPNAIPMYMDLVKKTEDLSKEIKEQRKLI